MSKKVFFWNVNKAGNNFINGLVDSARGCDFMFLAESNIDDDLIEKELGLKRISFNILHNINELTPKLYANIDQDLLFHYSTHTSGRLST